VKLKKLAYMIALIGAAARRSPRKCNASADAARRNHGFEHQAHRLEGALPVQVISVDQLDKQGITNAEQLICA
jgi:iron complex outermembrane receptor protein